MQQLSPILFLAGNYNFAYSKLKFHRKRCVCELKTFKHVHVSTKSIQALV